MIVKYSSGPTQGELFQVYAEPILCAATVLHVVTLQVFRMDPRLKSGVGHLLMVYMLFIVIRNIFLLAYLFAPNTPSALYTPIIAVYCEIAGVSCQLKTVFTIWRNISPDMAATESRPRTVHFIRQFLMVNGLTCLYLLSGLVTRIVAHQVVDSVCARYCARVTSKADDIIMTFWPLPVTLANTVMCVVTAWRVRAVRRSTGVPDSQRHGQAQAEWHWLLLKVIFVSGVQTDILYCLMSGLLFMGITRVFDHPVLFNLAIGMWALRGVDVFLVFVCKKEVWARNRNQLNDYYSSFERTLKNIYVTI